MWTTRVVTVTLALLTATGGAEAQRRGMGGGPPQEPMSGMDMMSGMMGHGMMDEGMMRMMGQGMGLMATGGPGPAMILRMREALDLTDDQITRLEALQEQYGVDRQGMGDAMMLAHQRAEEALSGEAPDFTAYEAALREAMEPMLRMHVRMARAAVGARQLLTEEQRERLDGIGRGMRGGMRMGPGMMRGPGGS